MAWGITPWEWEMVPYHYRAEMFKFFTWRQQREASQRAEIEATQRTSAAAAPQRFTGRRI